MRCSILMLLTVVGVAQAQTYTWNVINGSFQAPGSWTPAGGPPGVGFGVTAAFTGPSPLIFYLATFESDWALNRLSVNQGTTTLALNGHTLTANNLDFGTTASQTTTLNFTGGTLLTPGGTTTDFATGSNAIFTLNLDFATFSSSSYTDMATGVGSTFNLNIKNGSTYTALSSSFIGSVGAVNVVVDGAGSSFTLANNSRIGSSNGSAGSVIVQNGGAFNTTGSLSIGAFTGATGVVSVAGAGSIWTHKDGAITCGGGTAGGFNVNAGGTMNVLGTGAAAGILINSNSTNTIAGSLTVGGLGQSGITLNGGNLTINALGSVTTDFFTRISAASVLTINDGKLAVNKAFDLGIAPLTLSGNSATANPTLQFQNGAQATGITTLTLGNANRQGTLNVLSGSSATFLNAVTIGNNGTGTVLIDGTGSKVISTQSGGSTLILGGSNGGSGTMTVQNGGAYSSSDPSSTNIVLGQSAGSSGTLTITSAGSSVTTGGASIGKAGSGTLNVLAGSTLSAGRFQIGENVGGSGALTVSGAGTTATSPTGLFIGGTAIAAGGSGVVTLAAGGSLLAATVLGTQAIIYPGGTLTINGGTLTTANLTRLGTLNLSDGMLSIEGGFLDLGNSAVPLAVQGNAAGTLATLRILSSTTSNMGTLAVGGTRPGAVVIGSGAFVTPNAVTFATATSGSGSITLSGANTVLNVATTMTFGANGTGTLTIGTGSSVSVGGTLSLGNSGTIQLAGGTLSVGTLALNGGAMQWTAGTLFFPGTVTLSDPQLSVLLGGGNTLSAGRTLKGNAFSGNPLTLTGNLIVNGGLVTATEVVNAAILYVSAGSVQGGSTITNNIGCLIVVGNGAMISGATTNFGEIQFGGGTARLTGALNNFGRVTGTGSITGNLTNGSSGRLVVDAGQRLTFSGISNVNGSNAAIELTGGAIEFTGTLTNNANGLISGRGVVRGSTANVSGLGLANSGAVAFSGGFSDVYGKVSNLAGGQIVTAGGGVTTFHDDVTHNGAEIRTQIGGRSVFFGAQSGAGPFNGTGIVEYSGDLRPGNSPALVTHEGTVILNSSATFTVELAGPAAGSGYDQLKIAGGVLLGGTLEVDLLGGYVPPLGQSFRIIDFTGLPPIDGTFNGLPQGASFAADGVGFQIDYAGGSGNDVVLTVVPVPEPGFLLLAALGIIPRTWRRNRPSPRSRC